MISKAWLTPEGKFIRERLLNDTTNRFQLNFKRNVGPTSKSIRTCSPKTLGKWKNWYYRNIFPKQRLIGLGKKLYVKISEVVQSEVESITEEECIDYIINLVINRTYDGYITEKQTIYGQLQEILKVAIQPAPDEWDRLYNVDFYIQVKDKFLGLQIKPAGYAYITEMIKEQKIQKGTHEKFTEKYGGKVFYIISIKEGKKKVIYNPEVIEEIRKEIERLEKE